MKNKLYSVTGLILSVLLVFSFGTAAFAAAPEGSGTKADPIVISTADELADLAVLVNGGESFAGKYIVLKNDITASKNFTPIGSKENPFSGSFDGNGKTISGININRDYAGLFGYADGANICGITVEGTFMASSFAGSITAYAVNTVIENCICNAGVYADTYAGGIAGYIESGKIVSCSTSSQYGSVGGYEDATGGIAGFSGAVISNCENNAYTYGQKNVGGIAGKSAGEIRYCSNLVAISASDANLGGIAGLAEGAISYCKNTEIVSADKSGVNNAGGIVGVLKNGSVTECMSVADITATGNFAGGIAGYSSDSVISDCLVTGSVSSSSFAGGIFGFSLRTDVTKSISLADVSTNDSTDGGIGGMSQGSVSGCYYINTESKTVATGTASAVAVNESDFASAAALPALDFTDIWTYNVIHASYPLLKNVSFHTLINTKAMNASCTEEGYFTGECSICRETISTVIPATGHSYTSLSSKNPTCTADGYDDLFCSACQETTTVEIPATGHTDADTNNLCDVCKSELDKGDTDENNGEKSIFEKIADFFRKILDWFRSLFN